MTTTSHFFGMTSSSIFFDVVKFFFSSFCYWCKFHVNIIIDSAVLTIFIYKGLTRNLETGNTLSEFCSVSGDWGGGGELGIPNLARTSLTKCY